MSGLRWSLDGSRLATTAVDKVVRVWDVASAKLVKEYKEQGPEWGAPEQACNYPLAWTPGGRSFWVTRGRDVSLIDVDTGSADIKGLPSWANSINLAHNGDSLIASGGGWGNSGGRVAVLAPDKSSLLQDAINLNEMSAETQWHPDARRVIGAWDAFRVRGLDIRTDRRLGTLFPWLSENHWLCVGPDGHWRGSKGAESQIVYVAMLDDGSQQTFTPEEFAKKFGWTNDPAKARLLKLDP